jgi:hypothetical protein
MKTTALQLPAGLACLGLSLLVVAAGCGAKGLPRVSVGGKVTVNGTPVRNGQIVFTPERDQPGCPPAQADIKDGSYAVVTPSADPDKPDKGMVRGRYRVDVFSYDPKVADKITAPEVVEITGPNDSLDFSLNAAVAKKTKK